MSRSIGSCPFTRTGGAAAARRHAGRRAPGPRGFPGIGCLPQMQRDVLGLMLRGMHEYGDVVRYKVGPLTVHLLCHPDDIAHVFARPHHYDKNTFASDRIRDVTGGGLLVSNGDAWTAQRQAIQPAFNPARVAGFIGLIQARTQRMLDRWDEAARTGEAIDVASQMMRLTYAVVEAALFSTEPDDAGMGRIEQAITVAIRHAYGRIENPLALPLFIPTRANRRFRQAMRTLEARVARISAAHRGGAGGNDLLSALMRREPAARSGGGAGGCPHLDDRSLRSQTITLLLAGHETTANALTWLWRLLDEHPEAADRIHAEACTVLDGGRLTAEGVDRLRETSRTLREAMRLYTPIWAIFRRVAADDAIRGYRIRRGTRVIISPYVTHRHPQFWHDPERFDPSRFAPEQVAARPACAYIPFGGGRRFCVGQSLAQLEGLVIAAMVARRYRLRRVPGHPVVAEPGITLRCRHGLKMTVERRGGVG